jgi:hypothetical protein
VTSRVSGPPPVRSGGRVRLWAAGDRRERVHDSSRPHRTHVTEGNCRMGSVVKKRRKRMAKKKHRKLLRKTRVQRRRLGK